jgi:CDP-glycerol glycerophosphotransferase (TagB/SpsB family)
MSGPEYGTIIIFFQPSTRSAVPAFIDIGGLLYDYFSITPGPEVLTSREFTEALQTYIETPGKDSEKRICVKKIFHEYKYGLSYKRIFELINRKNIIGHSAVSGHTYACILGCYSPL